MKVSKNSLILTAAFAGLLGGTVARAASPAPQDTAKKSTAKVEKHSCAGKNSCSGQGGCATDGSKKNKATSAIAEKHSCKGKNTCKGNGGCATDGSANKKQ